MMLKLYGKASTHMENLMGWIEKGQNVEEFKTKLAWHEMERFKIQDARCKMQCVRTE